MIVYYNEHRPCLELGLNAMLGHQSPQRLVVRRFVYCSFGQDFVAQLKGLEDALIEWVFPLRLQI